MLVEMLWGLQLVAIQRKHHFAKNVVTRHRPLSVSPLKSSTCRIGRNQAMQ